MDANRRNELEEDKPKSRRGSRGGHIVSGAYLVVLLAIVAVSVSAQNVTGQSLYSPLKIGNPDAAAKVEVYYDLQCPTCANYHALLMRLEQKYKGKLLITFRHFPLRIPGHDKSIMAARIVEAANNQGKGWRMLTMVLANQRNWTANKKANSLFFRYATRLKLDMSRFREDFESDEETIYRIVDDLVRAKQLKLNSTPTVFLNGKQLEFVEAMNIEAKLNEIVK